VPKCGFPWIANIYSPTFSNTSPRCFNPPRYAKERHPADEVGHLSRTGFTGDPEIENEQPRKIGSTLAIIIQFHPISMLNDDNNISEKQKAKER